MLFNVRISKTLTAIALCAIIATSSSAFAALIASDNAADSVYDDGFQTGDNGGSGWGAGWTRTPASNGGTSGIFIGDSNTNGGDLGPGINTSGEAWGLYANSGQTVDAVRPFSGTLTPGVSPGFSIEMDNGFIDNGASVGFGLQNSSGNNVWEFFFAGGNSTYTVSAGSVTGSTPGFTDRGLRIEVVLPTASTYAATITRLSDSAVFNVTGSLSSPGGGQAIDRVRIFNFNAGSGGSGDKDAFFNSISVPEPSSMSIAAVAAIFALVFCRLRK